MSQWRPPWATGDRGWVMGLFRPSVKTLLGRRDIRGLVARLDQKDAGEAAIALKVFGAPAVPALIELLGTEREAVASVVLAEIGAPALHALVGVIRSDAEPKVIAAGVAISQMREKGTVLPDDVVAALVAIKTGGADVELGSRIAAASALGPLDVRESF